MKALRVFKKFPKTFWTANTMELFERWAWYGMYMVLALYLTGSRDTGALGFSQAQKGMLMGTVSALLYFFPVITGAIADRFGYKRTLVVAYVIMMFSYFGLGFVHGYYAFFLVFLFVAIGAALFKPVISATISKTTDDETSSIGFGIFYMMVNLGAFIGPIFAAKFREVNWEYVFIMSSAIIGLNLLLLLIFYREPNREKQEGNVIQAITDVFKNMWIAFKDWKFIVFLLLIVGFWAMYNQLFYTLPVFIDQWIDTSALYDGLYAISPWLAKNLGTPQQTIAPEMVTNLDAFYIVIFQILVSSFVMRFKPLRAMTGGFLLCALGIGLTFATNNPLHLLVTIWFFAIGEMSGSPKILEYTGKIAPPNKVGVYMGMSFLPVAGGNFFAGIISGSVYQTMSDKITLLKREVTQRGIDLPQLSEQFTKNDFISAAAEKMGMSPAELTTYLWETHHPSDIWYVVTGIGAITVVGLLLYDRFVKHEERDHVQQ